MSTFISNEEKRKMLMSLRSAVPATRFLILKKLADSVEIEPEKMQALSSQDRYTFSDILNSITQMKEHDMDEVIRREASITLEKIKEAMEPKLVMPITKCEFCGSLIDIGWNFCPKCSRETKATSFSIAKCPECDNYIKESWFYCTHCQYKLKTEKTVKKCYNCKRNVEESWMICPYCGFKIKDV